MKESPPSRTHTHTFIAGIDIASLTFVVRLLDRAGTSLGNTIEFANSSAGFKKLQHWLNGQGATASQTLIVMEATGVYWEVCALALHTAGFAVNVVNPAQIKSFARTTLRRVKTDATDADLIALCFECSAASMAASFFGAGRLAAHDAPARGLS